MPPKPLKTSQNEENDEITPEVEEVYKPDFVFIPAGRHVWRQEGPYLVCKECGLHHAVFIGIENLMIGEDEQGKPIIKSKQEVFGS
jgi:hypothetical protein